jgi:hypothetical protein
MEAGYMNNLYQKKREPIVRWLYAGPFITDVSHLYFDNYVVPVEPYLPFIKTVEERLDALEDYPVEGEEIELLDKKKTWTWRRVTKADKKVTWASMGTSARMLITCVYNRIIVPATGKYRFDLRVTGCIKVTINGAKVFEFLRVGRSEGSFSFEADLEAGENHCLILLTNVHLHCLNSFTLAMDKDCSIYLPLIAGEDRERIEEDFGKFYLEKDLLAPGDALTVNLSSPLARGRTFRFGLRSVPAGRNLEGRLLFEKTIALKGEDSGIFESDDRETRVTVCSPGEREQIFSSRGAYSLTVDSEIIGATSFIRGPEMPFHVTEFFDQGGTGEDDFSGRCEKLLSWYAKLPEQEDWMVFHGEFAKLAAGRIESFNSGIVEKGLYYINLRYDCSDFALHGLLRMYFRYRDSPLVPELLKQKIKNCILNFKYWTDEPGKSMMFTRSENHEFLFFSAEYLAGLLFPDEIFTNSNQNGLFHILKGRLNAERWIKEKGTYGFTEWHSNCYYEEDMLGLINLYDFGEENAYIRILAKNLLDLICFIIASHHYQGILATTHGRSYERMIIHPELESMSHINWLLYGEPKKIIQRLAIGALTLATSSYRPDPAFEEIAHGWGDLYTLSRMGLFPQRGLGGVNCATYRTADYMVSGLVGSNAGEFGAQVHAGQVTLDGGLPVFVTCFDNKSETTRPSYWGGQYRTPKTVTHKNILAYIYHIEDPAGFTHCYFPSVDFDETIEGEKWLFGRKNNAYIALYSLKPYNRVQEGAFKGRELLCMDKKNIWLIEMGNRDKWGSFEKFMRVIEKASLKKDGESIFYESPANGLLELGWDRICKINGVPVPEKDFPLLDNPYGHGEYGAGIFQWEVNAKKQILNFTI